MNPAIVCVLRSGGIYDASWVQKLMSGVARHTSRSYSFTCLTDTPDEVSPICRAIPLKHAWPGWWSKIELFDQENFGAFSEPVLYLDLDTVVVGDVLDLIKKDTHPNFVSVQEPSGAGGIMSTAMSWFGDVSVIYDVFSKDPEIWMEYYQRFGGGLVGDQGMIYDTLQGRRGLSLDMWPDRLVASFKHHCKDGLAEGARAVAFHGKPKPDEVAAVGQNRWISENWH